MVETAVKIGGVVGCGWEQTGWRNGWMDEWVGGWMGWWVDEWEGGWMGGWLGLKAFVFKSGREYVCRGKQKASGEQGMEILSKKDGC